MRHGECPCRAVEPYDSTYDLERRLTPPLDDARYATLERVEESRIRCRRCERAWVGEPLIGGGVYGDTLWRCEALPDRR